MKTIPTTAPSSGEVPQPAYLRSLIIWMGAIFLLSSTIPAQVQAPLLRSANQKSAYSEQDLQSLLEPIALYPDALIALILPAATVPADITLAARFLRDGGGENQIESQPWDDSVKSLARYPDIIQWMDENLEWTASLGDAFIDQPADVMNSMQGLREKARLAGNLKDTPQQTIVEEVVEERTYIRIVPTEPNIIYIPSYDPAVVYYQPQPFFFGPAISFGVGFAIGSWLNYDCDWGRRGVYCGSYRPGWNDNWNYYGGGRGGGGNANFIDNSANINVVNITSQSAQRWNPSNRSQNRAQRRSDIRRNQGGNSVRQPNRMVARSGASTRNPRNGDTANRMAVAGRSPGGNRNIRNSADTPMRSPRSVEDNVRRTSPAMARNQNFAARTRTQAPSINNDRPRTASSRQSSAPSKENRLTKPRTSNLRANGNPTQRTASLRPSAAPQLKSGSREKTQDFRSSKKRTDAFRSQNSNRSTRPQANPTSSRQRMGADTAKSRNIPSRPSFNQNQMKSASSNRPQIKNPRKSSPEASRPQTRSSDRKSSGGSRVNAPKKFQSPQRTKAQSSLSNQRPASARKQDKSSRQQTNQNANSGKKDHQKNKNR